MRKKLALCAFLLISIVLYFQFEKPLEQKQITYHDLSDQEKRQVDCLATNMYREAAGEKELGWRAVASVTLNRLNTGNYGDSVCKVVHQKVGKNYQFSWVGMKNRLSSINEELYNDIRELAVFMYFSYDKDQDVTGGATFYHADYVKPRWKGVQKTTKIGRHIFYTNYKDLAMLN